MTDPQYENIVDPDSAITDPQYEGIGYPVGNLIAQTSGARPGFIKATPQINLVNTGQALPVRPDYVMSTVPVVVGENSYELYFRLPMNPPYPRKFSNFTIYLTSPLPAGISIMYMSNWTGLRSEYRTPVKTTSALALDDLEDADPGTPNVSIHNSLATAQQYPFLTDYIILQLQTTPAAQEGPGSTMLSFQYVDDLGYPYIGLIPINWYITNQNSTTQTIEYNIAGIFTDYIDIAGVFTTEESDEYEHGT